MVLPPYLTELNEQQREAVYHSGKPLLILAGAGSGKTRVITTKIAYLIREKNMNPRSILAVTFTNKAAKEMASRAALIEPAAQNSMLRTFHSFGAYFLRCYGEYANISSNFIIYDDEDTVSLLNTIMNGAKKTDVKLTANQISRAKDFFLGPDDPQLDEINHQKKFRVIYKQYEERLRKTGNVDFGDLIKIPTQIMRSNKDLQQRIHDRFRVIMVDEYQDANVAQFELLRTLCDTQTYVCVVGDDDQSIYRFRGAEIRNILEFPKRFCAADGSSADIIRLEQNYRSTKYILDVADSVVKKNDERLGKKLIAERGEGIQPTLAFLSNQDEEVSYCAALIKKSVCNKDHASGGGGTYTDWAILYRTNAQSMGFENEFLRQHIPYKIVGSLKFYDREEIKDAIALLSFMVNPKDEISFRRVVNKPTHGVGKAAIDRILQERFNTDDWNIEVAIENLLDNMSNVAKNGLTEFLFAIKMGRKFINIDDGANEENIDALKKLQEKSKTIRSEHGLSNCIAALIYYSKLDVYHAEHDEIKGDQRVANLQELVNTASLYAATEAGLQDLLERIELDRAGDQDKENIDRVTLITMHNTKGLEFKRVIVTGLEQGLFPRDNKADEDLEEERRLFYVSVTRAMDYLYLTSCHERRVFGRTQWSAPSLFLHEADKFNVQIKGRVPYGFSVPQKTIKTPAKDKLILGNRKSETKEKTSSDGKWSRGDRVFHDDYGYGEIINIKESEEGPVIKVSFENRTSKQFLSAVQSAGFMKIKD
ncbi:MAG: UvrD-helicase domain-containing protein [Termitinemataceae bacterium]|nr:MAG: UvrD-helicase domain-containing protein [Termitinemataceae bacterium]